MMHATRFKLWRGSFACFMVFLFLGGLALGGSDFVGFPYGQLIGAVMLTAFGLIGSKLS